MDDMVPPHPPDPSTTAHNPLSYLTAGQQVAGNLLREAVHERRPIILLFGETGGGKSTLIRNFLSTGDSPRAVPLYLSATGGEFIGPPTFDSFLDAICQRVADWQSGRERPAVLAMLASAVAALGRAERTIVLAIDHADHLTDRVISDLTRLPEYLDVPPESFVRIFTGSSNLASRLDSALRRPGAVDRRFVEIRLSQPTAVEVATLLAYEDMAQPGGPMLTPGAIDRITAYAKSNLHWAVPLADAARALASHQGEREVTPELVGGALLELWPPGQQQPILATDPGSTTGLQGLSDSAPAGFSTGVSVDDVLAGAGRSSAQAPFEPASLAGPASKARFLRWHWIALAASALAAVIAISAFLGNDPGRTTLKERPTVATEPSPSSEPDKQQPSEQASRAGKEEVAGQTSPTQETAPAPVDEPGESSVADERPAAVPVPSETAPKPVASPPSSDAKTAAKKPPARPKTVKKVQERPSNQWIQTR